MRGESWLSDLIWGGGEFGHGMENSLWYWDFGIEWDGVVVLGKGFAGFFGGRGFDT